MGSVWKLVMANLRKDRKQMIVFFLIICLASLLLYTALIVADYGRTYDKRAEDRKLPQAVFYGTYDEEKVTETLRNKEQIEFWESSRAIEPGTVKIATNACRTISTEKSAIFLSAGDEGYLSKLSFLEEDETVGGQKIWINVYLASKLNVSTGDRMTITTEDLGVLNFTVAGIYEDLILGNNMTYCSMLIEKQIWEELERETKRLAREKGVVLWRNIIQIYYSGEGFSNSEWEKLSEACATGGGSGFWEIRENFKTGYVGAVNLLAAFMAMFAVIVMAVTVTTIAFVIKNNVEREIKSIGTLKAVGYVTAQIRNSIILEFIMVSGIAAIVGIVLSHELYPLMEKAYLRELTGLVQEKCFYPANAALILFGSAGIILGISFLATKRIGKLSPATALRFGFASNSFRKNHVPLAESRGSLNLLLAVKSCMQSGTQNLTIYVTMTLVAFVATVAAFLFYNTQIDVSKFQHLIQGDVPDAQVFFEGTLPKDASGELGKIREELLSIPGVSQVYGLNSTSGHVKDEPALILYSNVCENVQCGLYDGMMALEDNETVLAGALAEKLGVGIGDEVEISYGDSKEKFLVTGLQQAVYGLGMRIYLTEGGARRLGINTDFSYYRIRLEKPSSAEVDRVLAKARERLGNRCSGVDNSYRFQRSMDNLPVFAVTVIVMMLAGASFVIVFLVMNLIIQDVFVRREKEFGIKKAVGFTSGQLRLQLSLSLSFIVVGAAATGAILGYFLINPLMTMVFWGYGIKRAQLGVCRSVAVFTAIGMVFAAAFIAFLTSGKMKRLSAYHLIRE